MDGTSDNGRQPAPASVAGRGARVRRWAARLWRKRRQSVRWVLSLLITVGVFSVIWAGRHAGYLEYAELKAYDAFLDFRARDDSMADQVVVIGVTEPDLQDQVVGFPLRDAELLEALKRLLAMEPRAIGVDIYRDLAVPGPPLPGAAAAGTPPATYADLMQAFKDDRLVAVMLWGEDRPFIRPPLGLERRQVGFADFPKDHDGLIRRSLVSFKGPTGENFYSLAYRLAARYLSKEQPPIGSPKPDPNDPDVLLYGRGRVPCVTPTFGAYRHTDDGGTQFLFDYRGRRNAMRARPVPIGRLFSATDPLRPEEVRGKVVLIGMTTPSLKDQVDTPLESDLFGVEMHARAVDQLLRTAVRGASTFRSWSDAGEAAWTLGWALFGGVIGFLIRNPFRFVIALGLGLLILYGIAFGFTERDVWVPFVPPLLTCFCAAFAVTQYASFSERRERLLFREVFAPFVSPDVADVIWDRRDELLAKGQLEPSEIEVTILFSDVKGFARIANTLEPGAVLRWLNDYLRVMSDIVRARRGMVVTYMGDGIMAAFGAPLFSETEDAHRSDAVNAVQAALEMRQALAAQQAAWQEAVARPVCIRVGIFTGRAVAGCVGGGKRLEYSLIGDSVNTAARLEAHNKELMDVDIAADGCRILIGERTAALVAGRFRLRKIGAVDLPGIAEQTVVYGVVDDQAGAAQSGGGGRDAAAAANVEIAQFPARLEAGRT